MSSRHEAYQTSQLSTIRFYNRTSQGFALILVLPPDVINTSVFNDEDKLVHGITVFSDEQLRFNPTLNTLVPRHYITSSTELDEMKEKGITRDNLPKIRPPARTSLNLVGLLHGAFLFHFSSLSHIL